MEEFFERIKNGLSSVEGIPYKTYLERVWGDSVVLDANTRLHRLTGEPSVQFHQSRTEEYVLCIGEMVVYRGTLHEDDPEKTVASLERTFMLPGDRIVIPPKTVHVPIPISESVSFIEVSHGNYEESDVTRIYDKSGRNSELDQRWISMGYDQGLSIVDLIPLVKSNLGL